MRKFLTFLGELGRGLGAIPLVLLPKRLWTRFDEDWPLRTALPWSSVLTTLLGAALGITGFLRYASTGGDLATETMLRATGWVVELNRPAPSVPGAQVLWLSQAFTVFVFSLATTTGQIATYLATSGIFRGACVVAGDPMGDPLLTAIDTLIWRRRQRKATEAAAALRASLEGEEVRDRVLAGIQVGLPEADLVVIASRQKADWTEGTFVDTGDVWYRLGHPRQRDTPNGLRTLYPLHEVRDLGVIRRRVAYVLPESRITNQ